MSSAAKNQRFQDSASLIEFCRELGREFSERSRQYDDEGSFPVENFARLKEAGLLGIMIPKKFGGLGADFYTYTRALELFQTEGLMAGPSSGLIYEGAQRVIAEAEEGFGVMIFPDSVLKYTSNMAKHIPRLAENIHAKRGVET